MFRIKPHTRQRCSGGSNIPVSTRTRRPPEPETLLCLSASPGVQVGSGLLWGQGLWVQQAWVWHEASRRRSPLTPPQSCQNSYRTGETDSRKAQTKPCVPQDPGERSSDPTGDGPRPARECPGASGGGVGQQWPAAGSGALSAAVHHGTFGRRSPLSPLPPP